VSCVESCGSVAQTDTEAMAHDSSSSSVVYALTERYMLGDVYYSMLDSPCGTHAGSKSNGAPEPWQYLYMPAALGWDCYEHERIDLIDVDFRSPCLCKAIAPVDWLGEVQIGMLWGILLSLALFIIGTAIDGECAKDRRCPCVQAVPSRATLGGSFVPLNSLESPRSGGQSKLLQPFGLVGALVLLADIATSAWVLSDFYLSASFGYFTAGLVVVALSTFGLGVRALDEIARTECLVKLLKPGGWVRKFEASEETLRRGTIMLPQKMYLMLLIVVAEGFRNTIEAILTTFRSRTTNLIAAYKLDLRVVVLSGFVSFVAFSIASSSTFSRFSLRKPLTKAMQMGQLAFLWADLSLRATALCVPSAALGTYTFPVLTIGTFVIFAVRLKLSRLAVTHKSWTANSLQFLDVMCGLFVPAALATKSRELFRKWTSTKQDENPEDFSNEEPPTAAETPGKMSAKGTSQKSSEVISAWCLFYSRFPLVKETAGTSIFCFCLGVLGLWDGLPNPHHDRDFMVQVVHILIISIFVKSVTAFGCVLPVLSNAYMDMFTFGVNRICNFFPSTRALL